MSDKNPYSAPAATIPISAGPPLRWRIGVLILVALQVVLSFLDAPRTVDLMRGGDITPITAALTVFATVLLAVGDAFLLARSRVAAYVFGTSAFLSVFVLLQWRPLLAVTGLVIALVACSLSFRLASAPAKA